MFNATLRPKLRKDCYCDNVINLNARMALDFLLQYHNTVEISAPNIDNSNTFRSPIHVQDRRNNCDTKCSQCATKYPMRSLNTVTAGTSRYSDTTVYNKFRRQTRCVRYLDAPPLCVTLAPILRPSRIPDTYQRNYEICKQTRCNGAGATSGHVFQHSARGPSVCRESK